MRLLPPVLACALWLRRASRIPPADRDVAFWLLAVAPATAALLHVLVSLVGPDVFDARYLTALIPFAVALLAYGVTALSWRWASPATAVALIALATAVVAQRHDREIHPDLAPVAAAVRSSGATTVLTNSSAVAYYLRDQGARLDRPFGLSDDEPECALRCPKPLAIVDDVTLPGSARIGKGQIQRIGPIVVRVRP